MYPIGRTYPVEVHYVIDIYDDSGGSYDIEDSISDWNSSQNKIELVPWDSNEISVPQMNIVVDRYPDEWWGNASWSSPVYNEVDEDAHYAWASPRINSKTVEESIDGGNPTGLRQKVVTHEIGHNLGLGHPSASTSSVDAIMHQGWNGYKTVQTHDVNWINYRYSHVH